MYVNTEIFFSFEEAFLITTLLKQVIEQTTDELDIVNYAYRLYRVKIAFIYIFMIRIHTCELPEITNRGGTQS